MKHLMILGLASVLALGHVLPADAAMPGLAGVIVDDNGGLLARQGRGRGSDDSSGHGHGSSHDSNDDNSNGASSGSGRSKPRVPGGSGCDDAGDIAEHSECAG